LITASFTAQKQIVSKPQLSYCKSNSKARGRGRRRRRRRRGRRSSKGGGW